MIQRTPLPRRALFASIALPLFVVVALAGGGGSGKPVVPPSVPNSMGPIDVQGVTIGNFGIVDGFIYRGEQPKEEEYEQLAALGVKLVIDLRKGAKSSSKGYAEAAGMQYINVPIDGHGAPSDADTARFIDLIRSSKGTPVYVHCAGGRHRTGSMVALYRMIEGAWSVDQAYDEMLRYDFYTRNGHKGFKTYVFEYFERMSQNPSSVPVACATPNPGVVRETR